MSFVPQDENQLVVQRTDMVPIDTKDSRGRWQRFIDGLRQHIGLKPLNLSERWAEAKVRQEEVGAEARLLAAKADYELKMAQARQIEVETNGLQAKNQASVEKLRAEASASDASARLVNELLDARKNGTDAALENLSLSITQIQLHGGSVEFGLPSPPDDGDCDRSVS
jgi:hypothetical protein